MNQMISLPINGAALSSIETAVDFLNETEEPAVAIVARAFTGTALYFSKLEVEALVAGIRVIAEGEASIVETIASYNPEGAREAARARRELEKLIGRLRRFVQYVNAA
jgi:hypothetical protein